MVFGNINTNKNWCSRCMLHNRGASYLLFTVCTFVVCNANVINLRYVCFLVNIFFLFICCVNNILNTHLFFSDMFWTGEMGV